tara:strand:- start:909 stop:1814 length:906 start_codon:yes stop_codon:yes gene_type:complete
MRNEFVKYLLKIGSENEDLIFLTADLGYGAFDELFKKFGERAINCGICEQLMSSMACGLSKVGKRVITYSIGVFPTLRCLEQIRNDICYHDSDVLISTSGAGFSYGQLGMTHHCIEDLGFTKSIPNLQIASPASGLELKYILKKWEGTKSPKYLRLDKSSTNKIPENVDENNLIFRYKKEVIANKLLIIHGAILNIFDDFDFQDEEFNNLNIISFPTLEINNALISLIKKHQYIYTLEEHNITTGFGSNLISALNNLDIQKKIKCFGIKHEFIDIVGDQNYLRDLFIGKNFEILSEIAKNS